MIDSDLHEQAALRAALKSMAEIMAEIGWSTRFQDLAEAQALALATSAIDGFQEAMCAVVSWPDPQVPF